MYNCLFVMNFTLYEVFPCRSKASRSHRFHSHKHSSSVENFTVIKIPLSTERFSHLGQKKLFSLKINGNTRLSAARGARTNKKFHSYKRTEISL